MLDEFDKGPTKEIARVFERFPDYGPHRKHFWYDWGPVFYRGRLNGRIKVLCVASDPGPTERVVGRALVGDAGQRAQGFLAKLGITESYLFLNAFLYALHPSHFFSGLRLLDDPEHVAYRNRLFHKLTGDDLEAIVAFGSLGGRAVELWEDKPDVPVFSVRHPSFRTQSELLADWSEAITELRTVVSPDPDGNPTLPNYGTRFEESDYAVIPRRDLPFGTPTWVGDDAWGRAGRPRHNNSVSRPDEDDGRTLVWIAPDTTSQDEDDHSG